MVRANLTKSDISALDDLSGNQGHFPTKQEIKELVNALDVPTLREMSSEILTACIEFSEGGVDKPTYLQLLKSWIATAEETVAAGEDIDAILARRKGKAQRA